MTPVIKTKNFRITDGPSLIQLQIGQQHLEFEDAVHYALNIDYGLARSKHDPRPPEKFIPEIDIRVTSICNTENSDEYELYGRAEIPEQPSLGCRTPFHARYQPCERIGTISLTTTRPANP